MVLSVMVLMFPEGSPQREPCPVQEWARAARGLVRGVASLSACLEGDVCTGTSMLVSEQGRFRPAPCSFADGFFQLRWGHAPVRAREKDRLRPSLYSRPGPSLVSPAHTVQFGMCVYLQVARSPVLVVWSRWRPVGCCPGWLPVGFFAVVVWMAICVLASRCKRGPVGVSADPCNGLGICRPDC